MTLLESTYQYHQYHPFDLKHYKAFQQQLYDCLQILHLTYSLDSYLLQIPHGRTILLFLIGNPISLEYIFPSYFLPTVSIKTFVKTVSDKPVVYELTIKNKGFSDNKLVHRE